MAATPQLVQSTEFNEDGTACWSVASTRWLFWARVFVANVCFDMENPSFETATETQVGLVRPSRVLLGK